MEARNSHIYYFPIVIPPTTNYQLPATKQPEAAL